MVWEALLTIKALSSGQVLACLVQLLRAPGSIGLWGSIQAVGRKAGQGNGVGVQQQVWFGVPEDVPADILRCMRHALASCKWVGVRYITS